MSVIPSLGPTLHEEDEDILPVEDKDKGIFEEKEDAGRGEGFGAVDGQSLGARVEEAGIATSADFDLVADQMMTLSDSDAVEILLDSISVHRGELDRRKTDADHRCR